MQKKTHNEYVEEVKHINPNINVKGKYIDAKTKILHQCMIDNCEWNATPNNILRGRGCPVCKGNHAVAGKTDIQTTRPDLMKEWNWSKNNAINLEPDKLKENSNRKAWWICKHGHEWEAVISSRSGGVGCPICAKEKHSSDPEMKLYFYVKKYFHDALSCYQDTNNKLSELDVYIPSIKIGIEYDGERWHLDTLRDQKKDKICHKLGVKLIRIREPKCERYKNDNCTFIYLNDLSEETLEYVIKDVLVELGINEPKVCFENDANEIEKLIASKNQNNSLAKKYPDVATEWHPIKNGRLLPENISFRSGRKVWWKCRECGHEWRAKVSSRSNGSGCPACAQYKTIQACMKPVYCLELNQVFRSMSCGANQLHINTEGIYACCNGVRKSAGKHSETGVKLHWYYVYDKVKQDGSIIKGAISLGLIDAQCVDKLLRDIGT